MSGMNMSYAIPVYSDIQAGMRRLCYKYRLTVVKYMALQLDDVGISVLS